MSTTHPVRKSCGPGRPRSYDRDAALAAALDVFWRRGFEAASMEELCGAMGLSKSSFYACFGSKRGALLEAFAAYNERGLEAMQAKAEAAGGGIAGARAVLHHMGAPHGDRRGCFLVNSVAELAAADPELAAAGRAQLDRMETVITRLLGPSHGPNAPATARALMALGFGASALRKAGVAPDRLESMLEAAAPLLRPPS